MEKFLQNSKTLKVNKKPNPKIYHVYIPLHFIKTCNPMCDCKRGNFIEEETVHHNILFHKKLFTQ